MARIMETDTVWVLADSRYRNVLLQPRVKGFKKHPVTHTEWLYIDLEPEFGRLSR
jgi:oligopeptide transport system substrate-binding protein